jgi:hypothetical protein
VRARILDARALGGIRPIDVTAYLRASGWSEVEPDGAAAYWERDANGDRVGVTVPLQQSWRDYGMMVAELLDVLGHVENRSQLAILRDLTEVTADVVRMRAVSTSSDAEESGTLPLLDGLNLNLCGKSMMLAAACAAVERKRGFGKRKPDRAMNYVEGLRLGQSERGSYVLCMLSHVSPALASSQISLTFPGAPPPLQDASLEPEPYERTVTKTLSVALGEVERASLRGVATGSLDAFEHAVPLGVSADLCEALALLGEARTSFRRVDVRVSWSPARPPQGEKRPSTSTFTPGHVEVIREAGRLLRERSPIDDFELEGVVLSVSREPTSEQLFGVVRILASIDGSMRSVDVELYGEDWRTAHAAIADKAVIHCEGELLRDRRPYFLQKTRNVRVVRSESLQ